MKPSDLILLDFELADLSGKPKQDEKPKKHRKAALKLFEDDMPEPARAWTDSSPFCCIETDDVDYAQDN